MVEGAVVVADEGTRRRLAKRTHLPFSARPIRLRISGVELFTHREKICSLFAIELGCANKERTIDIPTSKRVLIHQLYYKASPQPSNNFHFSLACALFYTWQIILHLFALAVVSFSSSCQSHLHISSSTCRTRAPRVYIRSPLFILG